MAVEPDADDANPDIDELDATDAADQKIQDLADERAWCDTCMHMIAQGLTDATCSELVRSALDSMVITATARVKRILRSDLSRK